MPETTRLTRRMIWRYRVQGGLVMLLIFTAAALIHFWVGSGWFVRFGYRPQVFDMSQQPHYRLAKPSEAVPGVTNYAQVSRNLHRGAAATRTGYLSLKAMGIRTIVDLRELHSDRKALHGLGLLSCHIPMNPAEIDDDEVAQFLQVVRNPDLQPVFVHCTAGSDRTGTVVAIYRVLDQHWPAEQAALELPNFGFHEVFQPLLHYLKNFDKSHISALAATQPPPVVTVP